MFKNDMRPVHPGEVLKHDYLVPMKLSPKVLAKLLRLPVVRIEALIHQRRPISADTAMRLSRHFSGDARSWLNLQVAYDLRVAEIKNGSRVEREVAPSAA